jgi:hypothetical protein
MAHGAFSLSGIRRFGVVTDSVVAPEAEQVAEPVVGQVADAEPGTVVAPDDDSGAEAVPGEGGETEPESTTESEPAQPTDIAALETQHPWLTDLLSERDRIRENAGSQRRETQLRQEAASDERTQAVVEKLLTDVQGAREDTDFRRLATTAIDYNRGYAAIELARQLPEALLTQFPVPVEAREAAVEKREQNDMDGYISTLFNGAVGAEVVKRTAETEQRLQKRYDEKLAAEMRARGIEKAPVREAPPAVAGSGGGTGGQPTAAEYNSASAAQRAKWQQEGVEPLAE